MALHEHEAGALQETMDESADPAQAASIPGECPRCGESRTDEPFYGVCSACSTQLRSIYDGLPRADVAAAEYEPKMNVTPNAVASKE